MITITATIISGPNFGPVEIPIPGGGYQAYILHWSNVSWPVGIGSLAFISIMLGRGLSPKSVLFFGLRTGFPVSVWIVQWKKVPFQEDLWFFIIIWVIFYQSSPSVSLGWFASFLTNSLSIQVPTAGLIHSRAWIPLRRDFAKKSFSLNLFGFKTCQSTWLACCHSLPCKPMRIHSTFSWI